MVQEKQVRIDGGINIAQVGRVLSIFQRWDEENRTQGGFVHVGGNRNYQKLFVRETAKNILVRLAVVVRDGVQVDPRGGS